MTTKTKANTYNATQLKYMEARITSAVKAKESELMSWRGDRHAEIEARYPEPVITLDDVGAALVKKHPTLTKKMVARFLNDCETGWGGDRRKVHRISGDVMEMLELSDRSGAEITAPDKHSAKREAERKAVADKYEAAEKRLEAIRTKAMDTLYLGDQSELTAVLSEISKVSI